MLEFGLKNKELIRMLKFEYIYNKVGSIKMLKFEWKAGRLIKMLKFYCQSGELIKMLKFNWQSKEIDQNVEIWVQR